MKSGFISWVIVFTKLSKVRSGISHLPANPHFPDVSLFDEGIPVSFLQHKGEVQSDLVPWEIIINKYLITN